MRELSVRIKFTSPCLGQVKRIWHEGGKKRSHFLLPRNPSTGRVIFLPTWWQALLLRAAEVMCRHQSVVKAIRFGIEVDGLPRPLPGGFYFRYYREKCFAKHEAFFPGDEIGLTCLVPDEIDDDDFRRLVEIAGKYYGMSPARPNEYGFFTVESVQPIGPNHNGEARRERLTPETKAGEKEPSSLGHSAAPSSDAASACHMSADTAVPEGKQTGILPIVQA